MKAGRHAATLILGCLLCGSAAAAPPDTLEGLDPRALLRGLVDEQQVASVFDYLRDALIAAAEGREGPVPEILRRELDRIDADVKLRGTLAGLLLLKSLEAEIKNLLRPPRDAAPPAAPMTVDRYTRT